MSLALWKIERRPDGGIEVMYSDKTMPSTSCGLCSAATPTMLIVEWIMAFGDPFDVIVDENGREFALGGEAQPGSRSRSRC